MDLVAREPVSEYLIYDKSNGAGGTKLRFCRTFKTDIMWRATAKESLIGNTGELWPNFGVALHRSQSKLGAITG